MTAVSLITIDGVLRKLVGASIIPEGIRLYRSLATTGRIILSHDEADLDVINDWLELHGCISHDFIETSSSVDPMTRANTLRRQGYDIDLVVTPDPAVAQGFIHSGFNTLLFTHSQFSHPSWRPDSGKGIQEWASIEMQIAKEARRKALVQQMLDEQ